MTGSKLTKYIEDNSKLVSVIITCYNYGKYIEEAIESVLKQTHLYIEIIIIDDASTDTRTLSILKKLSTNYKVLFLKENLGPAKARNIASKLSSGKYLIFLDADDKLDKYYVEKTVKKIRSLKNIGFVYTTQVLFGTKNEIYKTEIFSKKAFLKYNPAHSASLIDRQAFDLINGFDEANILRGYEDWNLWLTFIEKGIEGYYLEDPLFLHREHEKSLGKRAKKNKVLIHEYIRLAHPKLFKLEILPPVRLLIKNKIFTEYLIKVLIPNLKFFTAKHLAFALIHRFFQKL